jgi:hypothetical protein
LEEKYPYTSAPNKLREFLKGLPNRPVPDKVTQKYLETLGMKSHADRTIIGVLKAVSLLDGNGAPMESYRLFRDKSRGPGILAAAIHSTYEELYKVYEDPHRQNDDNLRNFFKTQSNLGDSAINYQIATFKVLCEFADFGAAASPSTLSQESSRPTSQQTQQPVFHIDLHIHLPDAKDPLVHNAIFQAIARHLMKTSLI